VVVEERRVTLEEEEVAEINWGLVGAGVGGRPEISPPPPPPPVTAILPSAAGFIQWEGEFGSQTATELAIEGGGAARAWEDRERRPAMIMLGT
jgi:hypothetical protein